MMSAMDTGGGGLSSSGTGDLLSDTLMLDDFAPDIDLLDDILGIDYDWKELEPSLAMNNPHNLLQMNPFTQQMFSHHPHQPTTLQDIKPHLPPQQTPLNQPLIIPNFSAAAAVVSQQNIVTTAGSISPLQQFTPVTTTAQFIQPLSISPSPRNNTIKQENPTQVLGSNQKVLTQILPNNGQQHQLQQNLTIQNNKLFSFAGIQGGIFTTSGGNTVLLPQLQLAMVQPKQDNGNGDKLPMKRLTPNNHHIEMKDISGTSHLPTNGPVKKAKKEANRRSSHNAIERRYRSSINDKIIELKNLVCHTNEPNEKVHKAAVLRNAIDTVKYLQNANGRFEKENRGLKMTLGQIRKCDTCGAEQPPIINYNGNSNADLRELLTDNSPPPTSGDSSSGDSSAPGTPNSEAHSPKASPLALFAIAAGLFLINPIGHHPNPNVLQDAHQDTIHSRVERSVNFDSYPRAPTTYTWLDVWTPRLIALTVNLILFMAIYYMTGKYLNAKKPRKSSIYQQEVSSRYSQAFVTSIQQKLNKALKQSKLEGKKKQLEEIIQEITQESIPTCNLTLKLNNVWLFIQAPFITWANPHLKSDEDTFIDYAVGKCYVEIGKICQDLSDMGTEEQFRNVCKGSLAKYCGLKSVLYGINCCSSNDLYKQSQEILLSACMLTKSKIILRLVLRKIQKNTSTMNNSHRSHPMLNPKLGLPFFSHNLKNLKNGHVEMTSSIFTTCMNTNDPLSRLVNKYKYEMMWKGVSQLLCVGEGAIEYFKGAIQGVLYERKDNRADRSKGNNNSSSLSSTGVRSRFNNKIGLQSEENVDQDFGKLSDLNCEWWACILWSQAEWMSRGGRAPILQRLYKVVDSLWKYQSDDPLCQAVYFAHMAKRLLAKDDTVPTSMYSVRRLADSSAEALRDSINLTTDKPSPVVQLIWALTAEWILEIRLELWEEMGSNSTDTEFTARFSRDLDTLRSLTHYVPSCLPSLYLYEACLRLMSKASPGRTQQLLDASLRSVRLNNRSGLICTNNNQNPANNDNILELTSMDMLLDDSDSSAAACNRRKMEQGKNLVKEKRKAIALYLRCKHMPSQVITCPGEKAGMLREALKAMEKFGDFKKINECLDMIKSMGQSVTLH